MKTDKLADISSMNLRELSQWVAQETGESAFRAKQIYDWIHRKNVNSFDAMTNLSAAMRRVLEEKAFITRVSVIKMLTSKIDGTRKLLYGLEDGNCVEGVLMQYEHGLSLCISTQVGCRMGCKFCASTLEGLVRNLTAAEILGEIYETEKTIGGKISSVVLMGIGEPLDNYDNVVRFMELLSSPEGRNFSLRNLSLSTCGLCDKIDLLAEKKLGLTLSISLHASEDAVRSSIMPVNAKFSVERLMSSCKNYFAKTGRRISYEYALIEGVNDSPAHAFGLAALLSGQNCHVNLIPVNPVEERNTKRGSRESALKFASLLGNRGINATIRRELGSDINAACGQLRRQYIKQNKNTDEQEVKRCLE